MALEKSARDIFLEAIDQAPADRTAYLQEICGDDKALRQRVEALLKANDEPGPFLSEAKPGVTDGHTHDMPAADQTATFGSDNGATSDLPGRGEHAGATLAGRYRLIESLGEGGMGAVFMAQQTEPVKRLVAVKVIKAGMDSKTVLARFEAERQALAMMDHPNIARVFDAGVTESGRPFFVMELVKGVPITQFCDDHKLTPRQRLELFVPVCHAIQHAHQKVVIHRDIKPRNVLVAMYDDRAVPKVIDFGVAKAAGPQLTEHTLVTGFGAVVGTPEYMSPEQAGFNQLDVDTRSDVYSLGVLLYELLTGTTPLDRKSLNKAAILEVLRIVREVEAPRPSSRLSTDAALPSIAANRGTEPAKLSKLLRGELDWVVMKALEKDRTRRYETANGLARDVQRYLADEMIEARPPSAGYRLRKFVRRNRGRVIAGCLLLLSLVGGFAGTLFGLVRAESRRVEAEQARTNETEQRTKAEFALDRTATVLDAMTSDLTGDALGAQKELSAEQKRFLGQVLTYYKELAADRADDEKAQARSARAAARVAQIENRFLRCDEAIEANRVAIERYTALTAAFPAVAEYREELAKVHAFQADVIRDHRGDQKESERYERMAFEIHRKLVDDFPDVPRYRHALMLGHFAMKWYFKRIGKEAESDSHHRSALVLLDRLTAETPDRPENRQLLADIYEVQFTTLLEAGRRTEAEEMNRRALAINQQLASENPTDVKSRLKLSEYYLKTAWTIRTFGRAEEAVEYYLLSLACNEKLATDYPAVPQHRSAMAGDHFQIGMLLNGIGRYADVEHHYRKAIAIREKLITEFPTRAHYKRWLGYQFLQFGEYCIKAGKPEECWDWYDKAIRILSPLGAEYAPGVSDCYAGRALAYHVLRKPREAITEWNKAIELAMPSELPSYRTGRAIARVHLGEIADGIAEVDWLVKSPTGTWSEWYYFACFYAACAEAVPEKKQEYGARAVEMLSQSVRAGFHDYPHLTTDKDLDPIRDRKDFQLILQSMRPRELAPPPRAK